SRRSARRRHQLPPAGHADICQMARGTGGTSRGRIDARGIDSRHGPARRMTFMRRLRVLVALLAGVAMCLPARAATRDDGGDVGLKGDRLWGGARAAYSEGEPERAIELVDKAIAAAPDEARCYRLRGDLHAAMGQHAEAVSDFDGAIARAAEQADLYDRRGSE